MGKVMSGTQARDHHVIFEFISHVKVVPEMWGMNRERQEHEKSPKGVGTLV